MPATVKPTTRRKAKVPRALASIARVLRARLPALSEKYNFKSFAIFGSYARGEQKGTSDLDALVEYYDAPSISEMLALEKELSSLVGNKVDSHQSQNLKTYIGKNIARQVIWLQKDGVVLKISSSRRGGNGKRDGGSMEPEREYLDFMKDMVVCMENAPRHVEGMTYEQMLADRKTKLAVRTKVMMIGEAASRIPRDIQALYPARFAARPRDARRGKETPQY